MKSFKALSVLGLIVIIAMFLWGPYSEGKNKKDQHVLVLGLDGISYQTALKMYESGFFRAFKRPIPMISTFPSISDPNWAHIMKTDPEKGYTKSGFEMSKNGDGTWGKEYGNLIDHLTAPPQYEKKFDFKAEGAFQHIMSMGWSETSALYWTESLLRYLLEPKNIKSNVSTAFIVSTDIISHMGGEKKVVQYLKDLDVRIQNLQKDFKAKYKKNLEVILVSDHGNHFKVPDTIDYKKSLEKKGFKQTATLKEKTDYSFVAPEIISFGAFYTLPGEEANFAKNMAEVDGVHVALTDNKNNVISVFSKIGQSEITIDPKMKTVSYRVVSGKDPFDQIQYFLKNQKMGFEEYFFKTLNHTYPNALVRAWEGFYLNSQIPASVMVSAELGYVFTNLTLKILTAVSGVQSTHGSFHREESLGLTISTLPHTEEALISFQFQDFLKKLN